MGPPLDAELVEAPMQVAAADSLEMPRAQIGIVHRAVMSTGIGDQHATNAMAQNLHIFWSVPF